MTAAAPVDLLHELGRRLAEAGIESDVHRFGEELVIVDVDMRCDLSDRVGVYHPSTTARTTAAAVAAERDLPEDWLDDAVRALDPGDLPFETGRLRVEVGLPGFVLAVLLASPYPVRHATEVRTVLAYAGITDPLAAADLALETYNGSYGIGVDADAVLPDLRAILEPSSTDGPPTARSTTSCSCGPVGEADLAAPAAPAARSRDVQPGGEETP